MILDSLLPAAASTYAGDIDQLFDVITLLVGIPFLISCYLFFSFILRFKAKEGQKAMYITGTEHKYMKWIHRAHVPILTFDVIQSVGVGVVSSLAGGISAALVTTFAGLSVGIPTLIAHRFLLSKVDDLVLELEEATLEMLDLVVEAQAAGGIDGDTSGEAAK